MIFDARDWADLYSGTGLDRCVIRNGTAAGAAGEHKVVEQA